MNKLLKNNYKLVIIIGLSFLLVMGLIYILLSGTLSKYVNKNNYTHELTTNSFYFESPTLTEEGMETIVNNYNYEDIPFSIRNYHVQNDMVTTDTITYNISCSVPTGYTCSIDNTNGGITGATITGTSTNNYIKINNHTLKVTNTSGTLTTIEVEITATSTSPYAKTITGTYYLNLETGTVEIALVNSNTNYCKYEVTNTYSTAKNATVTINPTSGYYFDDTCEYFVDKTSYTTSGIYYNSLTANIPANSSKELIVYATYGTCMLAAVTLTTS